MKNTLTFLLVAFGLSSASAAPIVISDIDDTLKVAHSGRWSGAGGALSNEAFWGMPELLRALAVSRIPIYYVSKAPEVLMGDRHQEFLKANRFPAGPLFLRQIGDGEDYKVRTIRGILSRARPAPTELIMIGDNGQADAAVYQQIAAEAAQAGIRSFVFIRAAYSSTNGGTVPLPGQMSYVTSGEIAAALFSVNYLTAQQMQELVTQSYHRPGRRWEDLERRYPGATLGFPDWQDCREHRVTVPAQPELAQFLTPLLQKITTRCQYVIDKSKAQTPETVPAS